MIHRLTIQTRSFLDGVFLPWMAFRIIVRKPKLILISIIPIGLTLVFYSIFFSNVQTQALSFLSTLILKLGFNPEGKLAWILSWAMRVILFIWSAFTFSFISSLIACPFNDWLAEATEPW
ncbi:MAG: EI24 domain-containing protein, partial [Bdellovibrionia bacterium]